MSELYTLGACVLDEVLSQSGSLKGLVMAKSKGTKTDPKTLLALTANTLSFLRPLNIVIEKAELLQIEKRAFSSQTIGKSFNGKSLALVLAHDLLLAPRGRIGTSNSWPPKAAITRHSTRLKAELTKLQIKEGKNNVKELRLGDATKQKAERIPRWTRVNERLTTMHDVVKTLTSEGWEQKLHGSDLLPKRKQFALSRHLHCVLAFHPSQTSLLLGHDLYKLGHLILQDLASCFPAEVLLRSEMNTKQLLHVLDATAAPGNKTTHLSAMLSVRGGQSKITALEQSPDRYKTLLSQLKRAGALQQDQAGTVKAVLCDFTKQSESDYSDVTHMLLDPSCSGSGILSRLDYLISEEDHEDQKSKDKEQDRLRGLSSFQSSMIDHAMTFPSLRRFVYSTCSIHHEENESVVMRALSSPIAQSRGWRLVSRDGVIPSWLNRGMTEHCNGQDNAADSMVRCVPGGALTKHKEDTAIEEVGRVDLEATNGFFLACFERSPNNSAKNKKRNKRAREKAKEEKRARVKTSEQDD